MKAGVLIVAVPAVLILIGAALWSQLTSASGGSHAMAYADATAREEKVVEVAPTPTLVVQNDAGDVHVTGGDEGAIHIVAEKHAVTWEEAKQLGFMTVEQDNVVKVAYRKAVKDQGSIDFTIVAPRDTALHIITGGGKIDAFGFSRGLSASSGGGDITATDVAGVIQAKTGGGNIQCGGLNGPVVLSTGGGNISAQGMLGDALLSTGGGDIEAQSIDGSVSAKTGGGNITIGGRLSGTSKLSSGSGDIRTVIPPDSAISIHAATTNGTINDEFGLQGSEAHIGGMAVMNGQLNGGASALTIVTSNGNISIAKG